MASQPSFDITSTVDLQEVDNAVNQAKKEIGQRFDFKGAKVSIDLKRAENLIELSADSPMRLDALWDVLQTRLIRRNVPVRNMEPSEVQQGSGGLVRRTITLKQGISSDAARAIVKHLKDQNLKKVQAAIQADQVRVSSGSRDELQNAIRVLKAHDFGQELQFGNYRE
jgi:cyclic-di-GMP-binding protein